VNAKRALIRVRAGDERGGEERAWAVVRSAYRERTPVATRSNRWRVALIPALVALLAAVALSPAGATVGNLIRQALGVPNAARALFSLPAPGRLLLSAPGGTWTVSADGSARRVSGFAEASWSPHALYIAAAKGDRLAVLDPHGVLRWTLARPAVTDPSWFSPSGYRIAYLSGRQLRVVAGDGTGDRLVATNLAPVAPAWRPNHPYQLAYLDRAGALVVRDAATQRLIWTDHVGGARALDWSANGDRLLLVTGTRALVYDGTGRPLARFAAARGALLLDGALSPDGRTLALVRSGSTPDVALAALDQPRPALRPVLSGEGLRQVVWAPDGRWLLGTWPSADQWVFIHIAGTPRIAAVSRIAQQFASSPAGRGFPTLEGWCCTAPGG
jgi:hypothetical protein